VLVHNAGVGSPGGIEDVSREQWERVLAVNAAAPLFPPQLVAHPRPDRAVDPYEAQAGTASAVLGVSGASCTVRFEWLQRLVHERVGAHRRCIENGYGRP
jgi:NAD(P)-dependent dehydrogenase (short-subunit alcohol dehydrogenase family)